MKEERKRAALYGLLAKGLCSPQEAWSGPGEVRRYLRALQKAARGLGLDAGEGAEPPSIGELAVEHARLFAVKPAVQPTASARLHKTLMGPPALKAAEAYKAAGFLPRVGEHPDHIVTELGFLAALCDSEARDKKGRDRARALRKEFLENHSLPWAPGFFRDLSLEARVPFYRALGRLGDEFLRSEARSLFPERFVDASRRNLLRTAASGAASALVPGLAALEEMSKPGKPDPTSLPGAKEALADAASPMAGVACAKCGKAFAPPKMMERLRAERPGVAAHAARFCPECRQAGAGVVN